VLAATRVFACKGNDRIELPDGRTLVLDDDGSQPPLDDTPWAERVEEVPPTGAPIALADHAEAIDRALDDWNAVHEHSGCSCRVVTLRLEGVLALGLFGLGLWSRRRK